MKYLKLLNEQLENENQDNLFKKYLNDLNFELNIMADGIITYRHNKHNSLRVTINLLNKLHSINYKFVVLHEWKDKDKNNKLNKEIFENIIAELDKNNECLTAEDNLIKE